VLGVFGEQCLGGALCSLVVQPWCVCVCRLVVVAPNIDEGRMRGGLDDKVRAASQVCSVDKRVVMFMLSVQVKTIIDLAREGNVPVVFALTRRKLGRTLSRKIRVSVVGILNFNGADGVQNDVCCGRWACSSCAVGCSQHRGGWR